MQLLLICVASIIISTASGFAIGEPENSQLRDVTPSDHKQQGLSADLSDSSLTSYMVGPKDAKSFLRVRHGRNKRHVGEDQEEEGEEDRRRDRERNSETAAISAGFSALTSLVCSTNCWGPYGAFSECSAPCGNNGIQRAYRHVTPAALCQAWVVANGCPGSDSMTRACSRPCNNGGTPGAGVCHCHPGYTGTCCQTPESVCADNFIPGNGGVVCVRQPRTNTRFCQMKCNDGFEHRVDQNSYEVCGPITDWDWSYEKTGKAMDSCIVSFWPDVQLQAAKFYFNARCDALTSEETSVVKQHFLDDMIELGACSRIGSELCIITDVTIECHV